MRHNAAPDDDAERVHLDGNFTIGSDDDEEPQPPKTPPPIFRHIRDSHPPPSYAQVLVNRLLLRLFPRILLVLLALLFVIALIPGGWRVGLCAIDVLPPPQLRVNESTRLIGHRGVEFPYPENTIQALQAAVRVTPFVEFDVVLTSDNTPVLMHDSFFNRTTNGSGLVCMHELSYAKSLQVNMPERDPRGRIKQAQFCVEPRGAGTVPCTYGVPTLSEVFDVLPTDTNFIIDVKECYAPGITVSAALCTNCTRLMEAVRYEMSHHFISPSRVTFTSSQQASLSVFHGAMSNESSYAFTVDGRHARYKRSTLIKILDDGGFDAVSMLIGVAALRPDLVYAIRNSWTPDKTRYRDLFVWTIRSDMDYKLGRCAGATKFIVAEPERIRRRFQEQNVGPMVDEGD